MYRVTYEKLGVRKVMEEVFKENLELLIRVSKMGIGINIISVKKL